MKSSVLPQRLPSDRDLNRWIKRVALLLVVVAVGFTAFYLFDRWRPDAPPIIDQRQATLEAAVRTNPSDIASRGELADLYVTKGRYQDAITQYDEILATGKADEPSRLGRANAYMGLKQYDLAAADYQAVVDIAKDGEMATVDPTLESAYYNLADIAMKQSRYTDAVTNIENALRIKRTDADALYLAGQAYTATGALDKAEKALRLAVSFVPIGWPEPYTALADMFTKAGRTSQAQWASAMAEVAAGDLASAEPKLKAIVDSDAAVDVAIGLGLLYESKGDLDQAAQWYAAALAKDPQNSAAMLGYGRTGATPLASPAPTLPAPGASLGVQP